MTDIEIREIISALTIEEKADLCEMIFIKDGNTADVRLGCVPRFGIAGIRNCDNAEGGDYVSFQPEEELKGDHMVCYPAAAALAATFNGETAEKIGAAIGRDARSGNVQMLLRPGVNIKRTPLCGRNFEYYSEDPVLAGRLGGAFIRGVQSNGISACLKHYAVNNHEYERMTISAEVSERALREIYLRAFEIAVKEGAPRSIMTSYNKVNGEWTASSRHLIQEILRDDWGYDGVIVSDGGGIQTNKVQAHKNGLDIELSGRENTAELLEAVRAGEISEEVLDEHCFRVLKLVTSVECDTLPAPDYEAERTLALHTAEEGAVLLKNDGILPLKKGVTTAVIGALAKHPHYMGGGSGHTNARVLTNAYDAMLAMTDGLTYADGYSLTDSAPDAELEAEALRTARKAQQAVMFVGLTQKEESEGFDRADILLPENQRALLGKLLDTGMRVVVVASAGSAIDLCDAMDRAAAVLFFYYSGEMMGEAQANILCGAAEPGGRLPETFPMRIQDTPAFLSSPRYPNPTHRILYGEDIYVGYRWYEKRGIAPLAPFGSGLSYTDFEWSDLEVSAAEISPGERCGIRLRVKNTGDRPGWESVQLYIAAGEKAIDRPVRELKAFDKLWLDAGEEATVEFTADTDMFACYAEEQNRWITESGVYEIQLCRNACDVVLAREISVRSDDRAIRFDEFSSLEHIMKAPELEKALEGFPEDVRKVLLGEPKADTPLSYGFPIFRQLKNAFGVFKLSEEQMKLLIERLNG